MHVFRQLIHNPTHKEYTHIAVFSQLHVCKYIVGYLYTHIQQMGSQKSTLVMKHDYAYVTIHDKTNHIVLTIIF